MWTLAFRHHEDRTSPTHGYAPTREAAMAAFAKSWPVAGRDPEEATDRAIKAW
jgi:hypothetical protein